MPTYILLNSAHDCGNFLRHLRKNRAYLKNYIFSFLIPRYLMMWQEFIQLFKRPNEISFNERC